MIEGCDHSLDSFNKIVLIILICFLMIPSYSIGANISENTTETSQSVLLLIRDDFFDDHDLMEGIKYDVLEEYGSFILIETTFEGKESLEDLDIHIERLQKRDYVALYSHSFKTSEGEPEIPSYLEADENTERVHYIVQFIGPIKQEWKDSLREKNVVLQEFRHKFNYIVEMDPETKDEVEEFDFVNWIGPYHPVYRFDNDLLDRTEELQLEVELFEDHTFGFEDELKEIGAQITYATEDAFVLELDPEKITKLARLNGVKSITEVQERNELMNEDATWISETNEEGYRKVTETGVTGQGELITVMDSELYGGNSFYPDHEAWEDPDDEEVGDDHRKIQAHYVPGDAGGDLDKGAYHGTHVTGTVLGESPPYGEYSNQDGNALEARLIFQDIADDDSGVVNPPSDMYNYGYGNAYDNGSSVHTNSWGGPGGYTNDAIDADEFVWDHKDFNILYAMGNSGDDPNTLNRQAEGKNVFSVGGVTNAYDQNTMYESSSRGYADDGRIKPTVLHVAQFVNSAAQSPQDYNYLSGTSMSTPGIAGQLGQVRQYYQEGWHVYGEKNEEYGFEPSNALVRATMINGAVEITGDGAYQNDNRFPNNDQGFGRTKLDRALYFEEDDRRLEVFDSSNENISLGTGESWEMEFEVEDPSQELEITLAWSDYPGDHGSDEGNPAIVNDLDLEVTAPNETRYVGNAFQGYDAGYSEPDPSDNPWSGLRDEEYDGLNVEENVLLLPDENGVEEGTYEVKVTGYNVPQEEQPFAVVVSGGLEEETLPPTDPYPENNAEGIETDVNLSVHAEHGSDESMDITFYDAEENETIGTDHDVDSGESAEVQWDGLKMNTTYEWYAEADDGENSAQSSTWSFTTKTPEGEYFDVVMTSPEENESFEEGEKVKINYSVYNTGGTEGIQDIDLKISDEEDVSYEDTHHDVDLSDGESHSANFIKTFDDSGEYFLEICSEDDSDGANVTILEPTKYDLTILGPDDEGSILVDDDLIENYPYSEEYEDGVKVDLEAVPSEGFDFVEWIGDIDLVKEPSMNQTYIEMESDAVIKAEFEKETYELEIISEEGGEVIEPGVGTFEYEHNETVVLEAEADDDHAFMRWSGDNKTVDDVEKGYTTIEMLDNYTLMAEFGLKDYELKVESSTGGFVEMPGEGKFEYQHGESISLEARSADNHTFVGWTGDIDQVKEPSMNQTEREMVSDAVIKAEFEKEIYELELDSRQGGEIIEPGEGTFEYEHGSTVVLEAKAEENHTFAGWTGDIEGKDDYTAIEMFDDRSIVAEFELKDYELRVESSTGGFVDEPGEGTFEYEHGSTVVLEAKAEDNHTFRDWSGYPTDMDMTTDQIELVVEKDIAIKAEFEIKTYEIEIISDEGGEVIEPGEGVFHYKHGESITLEARSAENHTFVGWGGDIGDIFSPEINNTMIQVLADKTIEAEFEIKTHRLEITCTEGGYLSEPINEDSQHEHGTEIELEVDAEEGYRFVGWTGDNKTIDDPSSSTTVMDIENHHQVTAEFEKKTYELNIDMEGEGALDPDEGEHTYEHGDIVVIEIDPAEGWTFEEWSGDEWGNTSQMVITMDEDKEIVAHLQRESEDDELNIVYPASIILSILAILNILFIVILLNKKES